MDFYYGSKKNLVLSCILIALLIIVLYYFDFHKTKSLIFWPLIILFFVLLFKTIKLLTDKNLIFISDNQIDTDYIDQDTFNFESEGIFDYLDNGFIVKSMNLNIPWSDIDSIFAYKKDLLTTDSICLNIVYYNDSLTICEETDGWYQFILRLKNVFNTIPENWELEIARPAFEKKLTLLYDRKGRTLDEILTENKK